jgi:peptidoglycan/LPS O-acetylase OafA/YrhL
VEFQTGTRNAWCDCLRGYAILLICGAHIFYLEPLHARFGAMTAYFKGDTGVDLFYVLSGFLVTAILAREVEGRAAAGLTLRAVGHFFGRRVMRLQPSNLMFLALYALLCAKDPDGLSWWVLFLPLSNWFAGPYITWHIKTLHVEETYYLLIGLCSGVLRRRLKPLLLVLLNAAPIGRAVLFLLMKHGEGWAGWLFGRYLPVGAFAVGGLLVLHLDRVQAWPLSRAVLRKPAASFMVALLSLLLAAALRDLKPFSYMLLFTWPMLFSLCAAVMIVSGLEGRQRAFAPEWMRRLGVVSYTVYLFQQFVFGPWQGNYGAEFHWSAWVMAVVAAAVAVPVWYVYAERPLTDLGARWFPRVASGDRSPGCPLLRPAEGAPVSAG